MKKMSIKTVVAVGIGAALFFVLARFVSIPSGIPNTSICLQYAVLALFAILYGPVAGGLIGFIGHTLGDLSWGGFEALGETVVYDRTPPLEEEIVRRVFLVRLRTNEEVKRERVAKITGEGGGGDKTVKRQPVVKKIKVGPNDPCPCGSGKKYKKCCRDKDLAAERGQQTN